MIFSVFMPPHETGETDEEDEDADSKENGVEDGVDEGGLYDGGPQEGDGLQVIQLLNTVLKPDDGDIGVSGVL